MIISNISIKGIVSNVPKQTYVNLNYPHMEEQDRQKLAFSTGIYERRVAPNDIHTSDLCISASQKLMSCIGWTPESIDVVIFVTQTPDHIIPGTSHIIQSKLNLRKNVFCLDVNEGCAGYVYGLALAAKLLDGVFHKRCLLLVGDTPSKLIHKDDHSNNFLFGDCGTATAIEFNQEINFKTNIDLYSDGSGKESIIIQTGAICSRGYNPLDANGRNSYLSLKGTDVFLFAVKEVPFAIKQFITNYSVSIENVDFICLHQANKMINDSIAKKLNLPAGKILNSLEKYGNTSSASIPLSICASNLPKTTKHLLLCGFGVGLSWGVGNFLLEGNTYSLIET